MGITAKERMRFVFQHLEVIDDFGRRTRFVTTSYMHIGSVLGLPEDFIHADTSFEISIGMSFD
jgi:hypothetical protein